MAKTVKVKTPKEMTPQEAAARMFARRFLEKIKYLEFAGNVSYGDHKFRPDLSQTFSVIGESNDLDDLEKQVLDAIQYGLIGTPFSKGPGELSDSDLMALFHAMLSDGYHAPKVALRINTFPVDPVDGGLYVCSYDGLDGSVSGHGSGDSISEAIYDAINKVARQMANIDKVLRRYLDQARSINKARNIEMLVNQSKPKKKKR